MKQWLMVLLLTQLMLSCTTNPRKSYQQLSALTGNWTSSGSTTIFFRWNQVDDALKGYSYSIQNNDTLFFNRYYIILHNDSLRLLVKSANNEKRTKSYKLVKDRFGDFVFETDKSTYPFRITFSIKNDTLWDYHQENMRGNKAIDFELIKITP